MDVLLVSKRGEICREATDDVLGSLVPGSDCSSESSSIHECSIFPPLCSLSEGKVCNLTSTREAVSLPDAHKKPEAPNSSENNNNRLLKGAQCGSGTKSAKDHKSASLAPRSKNGKIPIGQTVQNGRNCKSSQGHVTNKEKYGRPPRYITEKSRLRRRRPEKSKPKEENDAEAIKAGVYRKLVGRRQGFNLGITDETTINLQPSLTKTGSTSSTTMPDIAVDASMSTPPRGRENNKSSSGGTLGMHTLLGMNHISASRPQKKGLSAAMGLTQKQIGAFREVFDLFDTNGGGTIDAQELDETLRSVDICLEGTEIQEVLARIDTDGNGEIHFQEFLQLMTNTNQFLQTLSQDEESEKENKEGLLFKALTEFMKKSKLNSIDEIVGYYHSKYKKVKTPHVVTHYAAGARLIGLTDKQLREHMEQLKAESSSGPQSPYSEPLLILSTSSMVNQTGKGNANLRRQASKPQGWVSQRMEHTQVELPKIHMRSLEPFHALTADDLPNIRLHVGAARKEYSSVRRKNQLDKNLLHWKNLATSQIHGPALRSNFRAVFSIYGSVNQAMLSP